jgi:hypothetical protein
VKGVEADDTVHRVVGQGKTVTVVGEETRLQVDAVAGVDAEQLLAELQGRGADVDRDGSTAEAVEHGGKPAAPGPEVENGVTDTEIQGLEGHPQAVEVLRGVAHGAERLVVQVTAAGLVGGDGPPVSLGLPVELLGPSE